MRKSSRVCLVSTVRNPGPSFESFLRYHLAIGFERLYIFFDDPKDSAIETAKNIEGVITILCDDKLELEYQKLGIHKELKEKMKLEPQHSRVIQLKQILNATLARDMALRDKFDWIFHGDCDELIYNAYDGSIGELMAQVPDHIEQIITYNNEAVPTRMDIENPFLDVTLFKKNPIFLKHSSRNKNVFKRYFENVQREYFHSYDNGKAAARVRVDLFPIIHKFIKKAPDSEIVIFIPEKIPPETANLEGLTVYHYTNCGIDQFLTKFHLLGNFPNGVYNKFFLAARDSYLAGDFFSFKEIYKKEIQFSDKDGIKKLIQAGYFEENKTMSRKIKKILSSSTVRKKAA